MKFLLKKTFFWKKNKKKSIFIVLLLSIVLVNHSYSQSLDTTLYQDWEEITGDNIFNVYTLRGIKSLDYLVSNSDTIPIDYEALARFIDACTSSYLRFTGEEDKWDTLYKHNGLEIISSLTKNIVDINECKPVWTDDNLLFTYPEKPQYCLFLIEQGINIHHINTETNETVIDILVSSLIEYERGGYLLEEEDSNEFNLSIDELSILKAISYFLERGVSFKLNGEQFLNKELSPRERKEILEKEIYNKALKVLNAPLIIFMNSHGLP
jgi:hypothetical protein